jgi:hypothetical protein
MAVDALLAMGCGEGRMTVPMAQGFLFSNSVLVSLFE